MPKAKATSKRANKAMPWYLGEGDEECPHCGQWYSYELEFRCPDCDSPSCPHCKSKHAEDRFVCPGCVVVITEVESHGG
jgi:hypothetical protein